MTESALILAIDTCGPSGSVALGRWAGSQLTLLGESSIPGREYSAQLVSTIRGLLSAAAAQLSSLAAIVVVSGPGSFTGVRVGLATAKGLAESPSIPVIALSRLHVLAHKAGIPSAAVDAHRQELFLRIAGESGVTERLASSADLAALAPPPSIAACDEPAATLLTAAWPSTRIVRVAEPTAADALVLAMPRILAAQFDDIATLDGHYLRRSDAEIFGPRP